MRKLHNPEIPEIPDAPEVPESREGSRGEPSSRYTPSGVPEDGSDPPAAQVSKGDASNGRGGASYVNKIEQKR